MKSGDAKPEPTESERCNNNAEPGQDAELSHAQSKLETLLKKQKPGKGPSKKLVAEQQKTLRIPGYGPPDPKTSDLESPVKRGPGRPRKAKPDFETPALTKLQNQPLAAIDPTLAPAEPEKGTSATDKPAATEEPKVASAPKEKPKRPKTPKKPKATLTAQQVLEEDVVAEDEADKDLLTRITTGREKSEKVSKSKKQKSNTVPPDVSDKSSTVPPDVLDKAVDKAGQNDVLK
ncbi:neurofilament medium polypeptide-like [Paramacrobiotus metropolitanus]|uniref:neurofilament medium polypeptide-like n=1 Tax=Paramacrobiotus metropolitanus TaxID=2943436 RepID=UPI00244623C8|nr:neurofilament medium polypeptide-like [Paramacrobiotus metropolitanus]